MAHLLFATPAFPPVPGGGERYARSLALALLDAGHEVTVVTSHARQEKEFWEGTANIEPAKEFDHGLQLWRCPVAPFPGGRRGLLAWRKLMVSISALPGKHHMLLMHMARRIPALKEFEATLAQVSSVDLVHGFNISWEHALVAGWQVARSQDVPFVVTPFAHLGEGRRARVARNSLMDHQRTILADADAVHTLTHVETQGFLAWGVSPRQVTEVGSGVDQPPERLAGRERLAPHAIARPFFLFLGRASYDKGAIHAVKAVQRLRGEGYNLQLVLAGTTTAEFDRYVQRSLHQATGGIIQIGPVDERTKHALLAQAEALLLPSRSDSFGIVLLEAWLHTTPVIGAAAGGIQGVVDDGINGLLVPFGDVEALANAIRQLSDSPDRAESMGRRGKEKVAERYTWDKVRDRVLASYRQLGLPV